MKYRRRVINKQRAKVSGMCDIPNSSYSEKGFTKNCRVLYGNAMLEPVVRGTPTWRPETSKNIWSFSQHIGYSKLENIRRINIFAHVTCYPETMPMSRIEKKPCSIFKAKRSTELKTGQQILV